MKRVGLLQDLIDELLYVQSEYGNDSSIQITLNDAWYDPSTKNYYDKALYVGHTKNGTIILSNRTEEEIAKISEENE